EVDRVHAVPLLLGHRLDPAELHDAGDVGQHVDPPAGGTDLDRRGDGGLVADVALDVRHAIRDGRVDVEAVDGVAEVAEELGGGVPDPGGSSGDDDDAGSSGLSHSGDATRTRSIGVVPDGMAPGTASGEPSRQGLPRNLNN